MGNQFKLKLMLIMVSCVTFIFAFSQIGSSTYSAISSGDQFSEGTKIASVDISGLSKEEAKARVSAEVDTWLNTGELSFAFGNLSEKATKIDSLVFSVDQTVEAVISGKDNPLIVAWQKENNIEVIETLSNKKMTDFHEDKIESELLTAASNLVTDQLTIDLIKSLKVGEPVVVSSAIIKEIETVSEVNQALIDIGEIVFSPTTPFSLLNYVEEKGIDISDDVLSIIGTGIYETVGATNIAIVERHISEQLPGYAKLGFEAKIEQENNRKDLMLYNVNPFEYKLSFAMTDLGLKVELKGPELPYQYKVELGEEEEIKPKLIKQYDSTLAFGQKVVKVKGENGSFLNVTRKTLQNGKEIESMQLSEDYYPPIHKVVRYSLEKPETPTITNPLDPDADTDTNTNTDDTTIDPVEEPEDEEDILGSVDNTSEIYDIPVEMK